MSRSKSITLILAIGLIYPALQVAAGEPAVYRAFVDEFYGFKRVIELNYTPFVYNNLTLRINVSDTVIWVNDASDNSELTIVSEQNLWDNKSGYLRYNYRSFNYTFTQPGTYSVYIKEHPRVHHQTIEVKSVETPTPSATPTQTPTATPILTPAVKETPVEAAKPTFGVWYMLIAVLVVVGVTVLFYFSKRKK